MKKTTYKKYFVISHKCKYKFKCLSTWLILKEGQNMIKKKTDTSNLIAKENNKYK